MPAKPSLTASISLHPRDGVTPETVGRLATWLRKQDLVFAVGVSEPNSNGNGRHLHIAVGFKKPLKVSDDYKDRLRTALREELTDPGNWGKPSIVCKAHHDAAGLVGGYYEKDNDKLIEFQIGTPPSPDEQAQGAARRVSALERLKKLKATKRDIPHIMKIMNDYLLEADEIYESLPTSEKDDFVLYRDCDTTVQVDRCYKQMILQGYYHLMSEMSTGKLKHYVHYWKELISADYV